MSQTVLVRFFSCILLLGPWSGLHGQSDRTLSVGASVIGQLGPRYQTPSDGRYRECWRMRLERGETLAFRLVSDGFNPELAVYMDLPDGWTLLAEHDDIFSTTQSRIEKRLLFGNYLVCAQTLSVTGTGSYTLLVARATTASQSPSVPAPEATARPASASVRGGCRRSETADYQALAAGHVLSGQLTTSDAVRGGGYYCDVYNFYGPGRFRITMRSSDFDAYFEVIGGDSVLAVADDGAGGTDATVEFDSGEISIMYIYARSYRVGATGRYTIHVQTLERR